MVDQVDRGGVFLQETSLGGPIGQGDQSYAVLRL